MNRQTKTKSKKTENNNSSDLAIKRLNELIDNLPVDSAECWVSFQFQSGKSCRVKTGHTTMLPPTPVRGWPEVGLDEIVDRVTKVSRFAKVTEQYGTAKIRFIIKDKTKFFRLIHEIEESFTD